MRRAAATVKSVAKSASFSNGWLSARPSAAGKQLVDDRPRVGLGCLGQVQVNHRGLQTGVAEIFLDRLQADSGFQQMGSERVPQCMGGDLLAEPQLRGQLLDESLRGRDAHRC